MLQANQVTHARYPTFNEAYRYDRMGRPTGVSQSSDGAPLLTTEASLDAQGWAVSVTRPEELTSLYEYDAFGNLLSETDASGTSTRQQFDTLGRLRQVRDGDGNVHRAVHDNNGNLLEAIMPGGEKTGPPTTRMAC